MDGFGHNADKTLGKCPGEGRGISKGLDLCTELGGRRHDWLLWSSLVGGGVAKKDHCCLLAVLDLTHLSISRWKCHMGSWRHKFKVQGRDPGRRSTEKPSELGEVP